MLMAEQSYRDFVVEQPQSILADVLRRTMLLDPAAKFQLIRSILAVRFPTPDSVHGAEQDTNL